MVICGFCSFAMRSSHCDAVISNMAICDNSTVIAWAERGTDMSLRVDVNSCAAHHLLFSLLVRITSCQLMWRWTWRRWHHHPAFTKKDWAQVAGLLRSSLCHLLSCWWCSSRQVSISILHAYEAQTANAQAINLQHRAHLQVQSRFAPVGNLYMYAAWMIQLAVLALTMAIPGRHSSCPPACICQQLWRLPLFSAHATHHTAWLLRRWNLSQSQYVWHQQPAATCRIKLVLGNNMPDQVGLSRYCFKTVSMCSTDLFLGTAHISLGTDYANTAVPWLQQTRASHLVEYQRAEKETMRPWTNPSM